MRRSTARRGFSLIELIVVLVILAILGAVGFIAYSAVVKNSQISALQAEATGIAKRYQAESAQTDTALVLDSAGLDTISRVELWDGRGGPSPLPISDQAIRQAHATLANEVQQATDFTDVYLYRQTPPKPIPGRPDQEPFPSLDITATPVGSTTLVMEAGVKGVCWANFGTSPTAGRAPVSVDCRLY